MAKRQTDLLRVLLDMRNSIYVTNPSPASMMEVARDLKATTEVEFGAGIRMNDGQMHFK